jgi:hypothetical protein
MKEQEEDDDKRGLREGGALLTRWTREARTVTHGVASFLNIINDNVSINA